MCNKVSINPIQSTKDHTHKLMPIQVEPVLMLSGFKESHKNLLR